jgi:hypothetical protein
MRPEEEVKTMRPSHATAVLATYHIRPLNQAFKSTFPCLSQLAVSQSKSTIEMYSSAHLQKG